MAKILIVDDNELDRVILMKVLESQDHLCANVSDATEARERLLQSEFDLIFCDIIMPNESGTELARFVNERYPSIAIIVITGFHDILVFNEVLEIGAFDYLLKPFEKNRVLISVANALHRRTNVMRHKKLEEENHVYQEQLEHLVHERTKNLEQVVSRLEETRDALKESQSRFKKPV